MPKVELPFEALLEATEQLNMAQLEVLAQRLLEVKRQQKKRTFQEEVDLLMERYESLTLSPDEWTQYADLLNTRRQKDLNSEEETLWKTLATRSEELSVLRVALLSDFARAHHLSLAEVMRRLKIKPHEAVVV